MSITLNTNRLTKEIEASIAQQKRNPSKINPNRETLISKISEQILHLGEPVILTRLKDNKITIKSEDAKFLEIVQKYFSLPQTLSPIQSHNLNKTINDEISKLNNEQEKNYRELDFDSNSIYWSIHDLKLIKAKIFLHSEESAEITISQISSPSPVDNIITQLIQEKGKELKQKDEDFLMARQNLTNKKIATAIAISIAFLAVAVSVPLALGASLIILPIAIGGALALSWITYNKIFYIQTNFIGEIDPRAYEIGSRERGFIKIVSDIELLKSPDFRTFDSQFKEILTDALSTNAKKTQETEERIKSYARHNLSTQSEENELTTLQRNKTVLEQILADSSDSHKALFAAVLADTKKSQKFIDIFIELSDETKKLASRGPLYGKEELTKIKEKISLLLIEVKSKI